MVTLIKYGALSGGEKYNVNQMYIDGLSTDAKPTTTIDGMSIPNGSVFTELDTGKKYMFDATSTTWYEQPSGGGGGGGGGTSNYNELSNRPQINSTTLTGNKTSSALGLQDELVVGTNLDSSPTSQSDNPVTSGGVYTALGNKVDAVSGKGLSTNDFTDTLKDKLDGIESGAEANVQADWEQTDNTADDYIKGKPTIPTVNDSTITIQKNGTTVKSFTTNQASGDTINITVPTTAADVSAIPTSAKGTASGVAELDSNGKVPSSQLPSYVDDVIEGYYYNGKFYEESAHTTEITGETGKIYIDLSGTNKTYRWSGSGYTEISESLALGETSSTAYRGDRGKTAYDHATESRLTTATESGLYKVASTAEGHIASLTSVQKSDITALGIPAQDTTYTFEGTYNASTNKAATMADIKDGKLTGYAKKTGNVAATDKVVEAIGKLETKADNNTTNIGNVQTQANWNTNNGVKNFATENNFSNTGYNKDIPVDGSLTGNVTVYIGNITSTDTDANQCAVLFMYTDGTSSPIHLVNRGTASSFSENLEAKVLKSVRIYSSDTYGHSYDDTVTVTNLMVCPKSLYDADSTYEPYALPNTVITPELIDLVDSGAKNLIPMTRDSIKAANPGLTWNGYTASNYGGLNFTINEDLSITIIGTTTATVIEFVLFPRSNGVSFLPNGNYVLSGYFAGTYGNELQLGVNRTSGGSGVRYATYTGTPVEFSVSDAPAANGVWISVARETTGLQINTTVKPMICSKAAWDVSQKYVPYRPTYEETVEQVATNKNNISKLIYERKNLQLGTSTDTPPKTPLTWTRSGEGMYYSEEITLSSINTILGWCVVTFTALKGSDFILVAQNDTGMGKFRLLASTDTYSTNASINIRIYGTTDTV